MNQRVHVCHCLTNVVTRSHTRAFVDSDATRPEVDLHRAHHSAYMNASRSCSVFLFYPADEGEIDPIRDPDRQAFDSLRTEKEFCFCYCCFLT